MKKITPILVDWVSTVGAIGALYALDSSSWTYLVLIAFGMAQKYCGIRDGRRDALRSAVMAVITRAKP